MEGDRRRHADRPASSATARTPQGRDAFEAVANGDGPALGRELEIADLLRSSSGSDSQERRLADRRRALHRRAPLRSGARRSSPISTPFWEFVSGPINAGGFGPNKLDNTFGPQVMFQKAPGRNNAPPTEGGQFYGLAKIDGKTGALNVQIKDLNGAILFETSLS